MSTISEQAAAVSSASSTHLPPEVAQAFAGEQQALRDRGEPEGAIAAGDTVGDFVLPDANGLPVSLAEILATGPAVVVFYRGGWCPYCNIALRAYQAELIPELDRFDATLVAISPQPPDKSLTTAEKAELTFRVLSDRGAKVARELGITFEPAESVLEAQRALGLDLRDFNATETATLPMPTVLVVDRDRSVRFADVHADYTSRTEVRVIIEALEQLTGD